MATAVNLERHDGHFFFEGTEKLLEVWFQKPNSSEKEESDLRTIDRSFWDRLLANVQCQILGKETVGQMDAYILSESSMFVSKNRFILKTCGKTTLLNSIKPLLKEAARKCQFEVLDFFYSHKNFMKPELQLNIHRTFDDEIRTLDESFENGAAYALGQLNKDCWYLYTLDTGGVMAPDQTLELLMTDLDPSCMQIFSKASCRTGDECTHKSGITNLIPGAVVDSYLFDPYGYSCNGLLENDEYFTIHVTPQPNCSYVSFETNIPEEDYNQLIKRVVECFKPKKFLVTLFANKVSKTNASLQSFREAEYLSGFFNRDTHYCHFKNYDVMYAHFNKEEPKRLPSCPNI